MVAIHKAVASVYISMDGEPWQEMPSTEFAHVADEVPADYQHEPVNMPEPFEITIACQFDPPITSPLTALYRLNMAVHSAYRVKRLIAKRWERTNARRARYGR